MLFCFSTCHNLIRTLPMMVHDQHRPEDLDTEAEDHAVDAIRYLVMSRPYRARETAEANSRSIWLVSNAFGLNRLRD